MFKHSYSVMSRASYRRSSRRFANSADKYGQSSTLILPVSSVEASSAVTATTSSSRVAVQQVTFSAFCYSFCLHLSDVIVGHCKNFFESFRYFPIRCTARNVRYTSDSQGLGTSSNFFIFSPYTEFIWALSKLLNCILFHAMRCTSRLPTRELCQLVPTNIPDGSGSGDPNATTLHLVDFSH